MSQAPINALTDLETRAGTVAGLLKQMANERRLLILCRLAAGKAPVSELRAIAGLSQSAMSQHLAGMRRAGLIKGEKDGVQIYYSITDPRCLNLLQHLSGPRPAD